MDRSSHFHLCEIIRKKNRKTTSWVVNSKQQAAPLVVGSLALLTDIFKSFSQKNECFDSFRSFDSVMSNAQMTPYWQTMNSKLKRIMILQTSRSP
jgi:hypothetical protein